MTCQLITAGGLTATIHDQHRTVGANFSFSAVQNGAFGDPLREDPIDFAASLAVYPHDAPLIEEADWHPEGTPFGI